MTSSRLMCAALSGYTTTTQLRGKSVKVMVGTVVAAGMGLLSGLDAGRGKTGTELLELLPCASARRSRDLQLDDGLFLNKPFATFHIADFVEHAVGVVLTSAN